MRPKLAGLGAVALLALLASAIVVTPAGATTKTKTLNNATPVTIPDATLTATNFQAGAAVSSIPIGKKGTIKDVNAGVQITHPDTNELVIYLSHGSTYIPLSYGASGPGTNTANYGGGTGCAGGITVFDGDGPRFLEDSSNPFAGVFIPGDHSNSDRPLSLFNGGELKGTWRLLVLDEFPPPPAATGTINCFQLTVTYKKQ